jgi:hypothetical protein
MELLDFTTGGRRPFKRFKPFNRFAPFKPSAAKPLFNSSTVKTVQGFKSSINRVPNVPRSNRSSYNEDGSRRSIAKSFQRFQGQAAPFHAFKSNWF